jgi:hypothetical protein
MATPTIAMIPSGYKAGTVYSVLPVDGTGDLTSTRTSSATRINESGLIEVVATGVPRTDYTGGGCPSLLLEPQATNFATYSEDFSNAAWTKTNVTVVTNNATSPDGTLNADTITATSASGQIQQVYTGTSGIDYNTSFWIRRKTGTGNIAIRSVENVSTLITVTDLWTRVEKTTTSTSTSIRLGLFFSVLGDEVELWGGQIEVDSLTSYIPNTTTGSTTRIADAASKTGLSSYINSTEGVLYVEMAALSDNGVNRIFGLSNGGSFDNSILLRYSSTSNRITAQVRLAGSYEFSLYYDLPDTTVFTKIAFKYKENDFALWGDGVERATSSSGGVIAGLDSFNFGLAGFPLYAKVKDLRVYSTALTDAELLTLTT